MLIDIIAEYLKNFDEKIKSILKEEYRISTKKMNIKYVITVPAMWTETGKATMIEAAIKAGLVKNTQNRSLQLITEPEAAALSCENLMKKQLGDDFYKESLNFIVCDAGGGTVDLVTFSQVIEKNEDGEEFGTIRQIGNGTGGTCGAVHLNRNFRNLVEKFYTEVMGLKYEKDFIDHHMKYFDDNIKVCCTCS